MSSVFSPTAAMVNGVNNYFQSPEAGDSIARKGGRTFTRAVADTALAPLALIETVVFAILTVATALFYITNFTKPVFDFTKNQTVVAANGFKNALAGIIGKGEVTKKEEEPAPTKWEKVSETIHNIVNQIETKHVIGSAAVAITVTALALGYYFEVPSMAYNTDVSTLDKGYNIGAWAIENASKGTAVVGDIATNSFNYITSLLGSNVMQVKVTQV